MTCPYCDGQAALVTGNVIYPHRPDLYGKRFWACGPCKAWVGCHGGGTVPLGRLANAELRQAKQKAHAAFDPLWKLGKMRRGAAYSWLAEQLGIPKEGCHIGMFDVATCQRVVEVCRKPAPVGEQYRVSVTHSETGKVWNGDLVATSDKDARIKGCLAWMREHGQTSDTLYPKARRVEPQRACP